MAFDSKCYILALEFLEDEVNLPRAEDINELAQVIQTAIENWIEDNRPIKSIKSNPKEDV